MLVELAIGDAYGAAYEFVSPGITAQHTLGPYGRHPRHRIDPGHYTDDTQMSIAVSELLVSELPFTREHLADGFVRAFKRDPRPGYARGFYQFLLDVEDGPAFLRDIRPTSEKNGAAMRAAPLGFIADPDLVMRRATLQARLTHDTAEGINGAVAAALMAHYFLYDRGGKADLPAYLDHYVPGIWGEPWRGSVGVLGTECVRAAVTAICGHDSLVEILQQCVRFGGDVDTVACIALAAASCSREVEADLPQDLFTGLELGPYGGAYLRYLDRKLVFLVGQQEPASRLH